MTIPLQVRQRAKEFFLELCMHVKHIEDSEGNSDGSQYTAGSRRHRGTSSICSNVSEVFLAGETTPVNNNTDLEVPFMINKHDNSGSASSASGYSSAEGADVCEPCMQTPPDQSKSPTHQASSHSIENTVKSNMPPTVTTNSQKQPYGCPNVTLTMDGEPHTVAFPSISSGRGSFDESDLPCSGVSQDILLVSHGGFIKEIIHLFVEELDCEMPAGQEALTRSPYNTSVSKFSIHLAEDCKPKRLICILLNDKDHLIGRDLDALEKTDEVKE